jgi:hypothetical protein
MRLFFSIMLIASLAVVLYYGLPVLFAFLLYMRGW